MASQISNQGPLRFMRLKSHKLLSTTHSNQRRLYSIIKQLRALSGLRPNRSEFLEVSTDARAKLAVY